MAARQLSWLEAVGSAGTGPGVGELASARRIEVGPGSWIEVVHGWVRGTDALFAALERSMRWRAEQRVMYERRVDVPRLIARVPDDGAGHPVLHDMQAALAARYLPDDGVATFDSVLLALYRGGNDSVAWHRDRGHRDRERSVAAVASLGGPRRFLVRPLHAVPGAGPRASRTLVIESGDLVVMGGACQREVEHCVPKERHAAPRMALMFRHAAPIAPLALTAR